MRQVKCSAQTIATTIIIDKDGKEHKVTEFNDVLERMAATETDAIVLILILDDLLITLSEL